MTEAKKKEKEKIETNKSGELLWITMQTKQQFPG